MGEGPYHDDKGGLAVSELSTDASPDFPIKRRHGLNMTFLPLPFRITSMCFEKTEAVGLRGVLKDKRMMSMLI